MINIFLGIIATLFTAALVLQIIGIWKKIPLMVLITKPFLISMILISYILLIKNYLPDSRLLLIHGTTALSLAFTGTVLFMIEDKKLFTTGGAVCFFISILENLAVTYPSFKLYPQKLWFILLFTVLLCAAAIACFLLFIKSRKLSSTLIYFFSMAVTGLYVYSALITLFGEPELYSALLFAGSVFFMFSLFTKIKREADENSPLLSFLSIITCTISQLLFASGCVLMQVM